MPLPLASILPGDKYANALCIQVIYHKFRSIFIYLFIFSFFNVDISKWKSKKKTKLEMQLTAVVYISIQQNSKNQLPKKIDTYLYH